MLHRTFIWLFLVGLLPAPTAWAEEPIPGERQPIPRTEKQDTETEVFLVKATPTRGIEQKELGGLAFEVFLAGCKPTDDPILSGTTNPSGEARIELPKSAIEVHANGGREVRLRISEPGWQHRWAKVVRASSEGEPAELRVEPRRGSSALGRTTDPHGKPIFAKLQLRQVPGESASKLKPSLEQPFDGWFYVHFQKDQSIDLRAEKKGFGTAVRCNIDLMLDKPVQDLRLQLQSLGVLRGVIETTEGRPQVGLWISARHSAGDNQGSVHSPELKARLWHQDNLGNRIDSVITDRDGRFEITGLAHGKYEVIPRRISYSPFQSDPISGSPVPADGELQRLIFNQPSIEIQLLDSVGRHHSGPIHGSFWKATGGQSTYGKWLNNPTVLVFPTAKGDFQRSVHYRRPVGHRLGDGLAVFQAEADTSYWVGVFGGGFATHLQLVKVPSEGLPGRLVFQAKAPKAPASGFLKAKVVPPAGHERDTWTTRLWVETIKECVPLWNFGYHSIAPELISLPPGRYRLVAAGSDHYSPHHTLYRELGRSETIFEIQAGQTTRETLYLPLGAKLALTLEGKWNVEDLSAIEKELAGVEENWLRVTQNTTLKPDYMSKVRQYRAYCQVTIVGKRSQPRYPHWYTDPTSFFPRALSSWPLGQEKTSQVLPQGDFEVHVTLPGGRKFKKPVTLLPGETSSLVIDW